MKIKNFFGTMLCALALTSITCSVSSCSKDDDDDKKVEVPGDQGGQDQQSDDYFERTADLSATYGFDCKVTIKAWFANGECNKAEIVYEVKDGLMSQALLETSKEEYGNARRDGNKVIADATSQFKGQSRMVIEAAAALLAQNA